MQFGASRSEAATATGTAPPGRSSGSPAAARTRPTLLGRPVACSCLPEASDLSECSTISQVDLSSPLQRRSLDAALPAAPARRRQGPGPPAAVGAMLGLGGGRAAACSGAAGKAQQAHGEVEEVPLEAAAEVCQGACACSQALPHACAAARAGVPHHATYLLPPPAQERRLARRGLRRDADLHRGAPQGGRGAAGGSRRCPGEEFDVRSGCARRRVVGRGARRREGGRSAMYVCARWVRTVCVTSVSL